MVRGILYFLLVFVPISVNADTVSVAVASNFKETLRNIADRFEAETGHKVELSAASSGKQYAQISNGAPFQVFFSADEERPALLEQQGPGVPGTRFVYARGRVLLWAPGTAGDCLAALRDGQFRHLAMANPKTAPYGAAAEQALAALELTTLYEGRVVTGENISQTLQFVDSGAAEAGFVAASLWLAAPDHARGCHWDVPAAMIQPINQAAILLKPGEHSAAARAFLDFLSSPAAHEIIEAGGYTTAN